MLTTTDFLGDVFCLIAFVLWAISLIGMGASVLMPEGTPIISDPKFFGSLFNMFMIGAFIILFGFAFKIIIILNIESYLIESKLLVFAKVWLS